MTQQLTLEISDEVYSDLLQKANAAGISITDWIAATLSRQDQMPSSTSSSTEHQKAERLSFRDYAGAVSLGHSTGADNAEIDADLAKAYANDY